MAVTTQATRIGLSVKRIRRIGLHLWIPVVGFSRLSSSRSARPSERLKEAAMTARDETEIYPVDHVGHDGTMLSALSNEMVALYKTQLGRGPTKVRSHWAGADALLVTLEDSLTPAEQRLVEMGEHGRLRDTRTFFQYATATEFIEVAERLTKRRVRAFVSGIDTAADVSSEVFYFEAEALPGDLT
jgi:uncharacterized protein YbcI